MLCAQRLYRRALLWCLLLLLVSVLATCVMGQGTDDDDNDIGATADTDDDDNDGSPPLSTEDSDSDNAPTTLDVSPPPDAVESPSDQEPVDPTPSPSPTTPKPPPETRIELPTNFVPPPTTDPSSPSSSLSPVFPPGSDSCQKCRYYYPKLAECNRIANETLSRIPREPLDAASYVVLSPPVNFTVIQPLLQCLCPNQGLAATKVCTTCFSRATQQTGFLDALVAQNVTSQLSNWQQACLDSGMGQHVPPPGSRGPSAATAANGAAITINNSPSRRALIVAGVVVVVVPSCPRFMVTIMVTLFFWMGFPRGTIWNQ